MADFTKVRAVVFDLDQTLIDFNASRGAALEEVLDRIHAQGYPVPRQAFLNRHSELTRAEDEAYLATGTWRPTEERFEALCREFALPGDGFGARLARLYQEARYRSLRPFPEARGVLCALSPHPPLYLVTNGPAKHQHREVEVTGLAPFFRHVFVCDDWGLRKPDPRVFEMIRAQAAVAPDEILIVGDNFPADIETPRKLGWRTAWIVREAEAFAKAGSAGADAVVRTVAEIPPLLGR